jgi:amidophosphoribosyltransferase
MGGLIGTGDGFVARDPHGIRPAFYYVHDDYVVVASERPAIATAFHLPIQSIQELAPGHTLWMKKNGEVEIAPFTDTIPAPTSCSFERIYFSRGNDPDIYKERKALGHHIVPGILEAVGYDLVNTVFSYIPNTSETAFLGMIEGLERHLDTVKRQYLLQMQTTPTEGEIDHILSLRLRVEKVVIKDVKLRTFITDDANRDDLVTHVYDITHGILRAGEDTIVCIDDSIVRGTTLKKSILRMLDRLKPKKIVIVSSAPQIRYPDCYGIDMSKLGEFVAFNAAIALLKERKQESFLESLYLSCVELEANQELHTRNLVQEIYAPFTVSEISEKISELLTPEGMNCKVSVVYPDLVDLKRAIPHHTGDWYFSGNYPTPGGNRVVNRAFMNFMEGKLRRSY